MTDPKLCTHWTPSDGMCGQPALDRPATEPRRCAEHAEAPSVDALVTAYRQADAAGRDAMYQREAWLRPVLDEVEHAEEKP